MQEQSNDKISENNINEKDNINPVINKETPLCVPSLQNDDDSDIIIDEIDLNIDRKLRHCERLRSKNDIALLFSKGQSFVTYPFRIVYTILPENSETSHCAMFVSVPKKKFKRAVKRNLIRRRSKEAYRLNKNIILDTLKEYNLKIGVAFLYLDKEIRDYKEIEKAMTDMLYKLKNKLSEKYGKAK